MKLKSLLLGSAAALVVLSGARAADAVIAEPEPVEYVRICDAYGAGYFYIPGTETCLKIGGYVRYQIDVKTGDKTWGKTVQANLTFSAKSDTELGTLEGFVEFTDAFNDVVAYTIADGPDAGTAPDVIFVDKGMGIDSAYIQLGGLKMGAYDNAFDGGIGGENDSLGTSKGPTIQYTFASNGFDATVGLDHMGSSGETDFIPNVSANAGFSAGPVAVRLFGAYDQELEEGAVKLRIGADVTEGGRFEAAVLYATGVNYVWKDSEWSLAASYTQKVSDTVKVSVGAQYFADTNFGSAGTPSKYTIGANVDWTPVKNFLVRAQVQYEEKSTADGTFKGRLRFQRSF